MELLDVDRSIVVVIDMQGKLMELIERRDTVVAATQRLMRLADLFEVPVLMTEQYPQGLGRTHPALLATFDELQTPKLLVEKDTFGACGEPGFEEGLQSLRGDVPPDRRQLVVAGIEAHICVMQTALQLLRENQQVFLCWECVSGRGAEYREWALQRMHQAGAVITNHESVGFEWAGDKSHPRFREMSALFKEGQIG